MIRLYGVNATCFFSNLAYLTIRTTIKFQPECMSKILLFLLIFCSLNCFNQGTYRTYYGDYMSPAGTLRALNIFVNIIYDQTPDDDPMAGELTPLWMPGQANSINNNPPAYLEEFMDNEYTPDNLGGSFTRRYAEASFNQLIVLGDFVVVNISQSRITPDNPGGKFGYIELIEESIQFINEYGGLQALHNHNTITDYDGMQISPSSRFLPKGPSYNRKIDLIQFFVRNCTEKHGSLNSGGHTGFTIGTPVLINDSTYYYDTSTIQGAIGNRDLAHPPSQPTEIHELAHNILGMSNSAHTGGGGPVNSGDLVTLEFNSGGFSLIGSAGSSMISCNGYERWRLNYRGPSNSSFPIAVSNMSSDIGQAEGAKTFYLRDFMTYGDAIRIKLPYVDEGALNQYIWFENHQIHHNNQEEYPAYWNESCRDEGLPGIYAYFQVGKDVLESNAMGDLMPSLTDNLIPISAEGNWDVKLDSNTATACISGTNIHIQDYFQTNPLSGYNDLKNHYFNSISENTINWKKHRYEFIIKLQNGLITNKLSNMGDDEDPFTNTGIMNICSNPAPFNVVTYHHRRSDNKGTITKSARTDNRKIHLSGLKIAMQDQQDGNYKMDISWDSYDVSNSVRWTGDIVLHERVNLLSNDTISLDQNYTPNTHIRNSTTGVFSGPSYFTCLNNSFLILQPKSDFICQNLSSLVFESGSYFEINDGAALTIKTGCTLIVRSGASIVVKGEGRIDIESGAYISVEDGANINFTDRSSGMSLHKGYISGVNPGVNIQSSSGIENIPASLKFSGKGSIKLKKRSN
jgi:hypothetical protein